MFKVYVIKSLKDGRLYVGFTLDIKRRLNEHNNGKTRSTKGFVPWRLVYTEEIENRKDARLREKFLKSGCGKEYIKNWLHSIIE